MSGKKWILLVAGSKGWEHYKHQANVCGLYQIIKKHGIPDERIVVMMYDDIAHNPKNPTKGTIVSVADDSNVYTGVPKDYTRKDLTPENFLAALKGDKSTNKKVIDSGPNDHIYVYMTGLGQEGAFQFPEKALYPKDLIGTIKSMHDGKKFSKMMIFMDSSYSGSMLTHLPNNVNVFALTSCHEYIENTPSDYDDKRKVFLSDKFSRTWLKHLNKTDFTKETFNQVTMTKQSKHLAKNAEGPLPCHFGDMKIPHRHLSEFLQQ